MKGLNTFLFKISGKSWAEAVPPKSDCFVRNVDSYRPAGDCLANPYSGAHKKDPPHYEVKKETEHISSRQVGLFHETF